MSVTRYFGRLGLGRVAYHLYFRPIGRIRTSLRNGGPVAEYVTERQRREMEAAATRLPALPEFPGTAVTLHLMTGRRFWYQTVFCLHSFARAANMTVHAELYDDGSIDELCAARLQRLGPTIRLHSQTYLREKLDALLPARQYPALRERWVNYPNIRKLIDVHLGASGWKLVLDSDLLFFHRPNAILDWLAAPDRLLCAVDCAESYGYSRGLMEQLAGSPLPARLNVGICGLRSEDLNWDLLESWTREMHSKEGTNYYLEQALVAMFAANRPRLAVPAGEYITGPSLEDVLQRRGAMHHYVDTSKRWYFSRGWRLCGDAWGLGQSL